MPYQYVNVGEVFKEDTWVQAGEARPDNHALVHHIIAYVIPPKDYVEPDVTTFTPEKIREMQKAQAASNNKTGSAAGSGGIRTGKPPGGLTNLARAFLPNGQAEMQKRPPTLDGVGQGLLIAYAPGDQPMILAPGQAKLIPKGSQIVLQMRYTPNGKAGTDCSSIGLVFAKEPPKNQVRSRSVMNPRFEIPPGDANYEVKSCESI